jgi:hypothetical protein
MLRKPVRTSIESEGKVGKVQLDRTLAVGLLMLSGCDAARSVGNDFTRQANPHPSSSVATAPSAGSSTQTSKQSKVDPPGGNKVTTTGQTADNASEPRLHLIGKSESELRKLLGSPNYEEDRAPGKLWRYQDGPCTLDIHLFPDVQTHQFGTLSYEVLSHDNTDEGKRHCMAQLESRTVIARQ